MSLQRFIQNLPLDKKEHLVLGIVYSILIPLGGVLFGLFGALVGLAIGTFLNLYKELYHDLYKKKGNAELYDFIATEIPLIITFISYVM